MWFLDSFLILTAETFNLSYYFLSFTEFYFQEKLSIFSAYFDIFNLFFFFQIQWLTY